MRADAAQLILASGSPRRRELLQQIGVSFRVQAADIDETPAPGESPRHLVQRLAREKALAVKREHGRVIPAPVVLAADTIVVCDAQVLGKPRDEADAQRMLSLLSGRSHQVLTAVAVCQGERLEARLSESSVQFRTLEHDEITAYWASGEPSGKAGSYAIQGIGGMFVQHLEGSYSGVVGLPLCESAALLTAFSVPHALSAPRSG